MSESTRRRWGVPAAAATAVLAVVGVSLLADVDGAGPDDDRARLSSADLSGCGLLTSVSDLADFERVVLVDHAAGALSFWAAGDRWLVCDDASVLGVVGLPDVWMPPQRLGADGFDPRDLAYRASVVRGVDGSVEAVHLVAGGKLMTDMESISYTFPDGHEERAQIIEAGGDHWWFVTYTATHGPLLHSPDPADVGRTVVSLLTPSDDRGGGPMIGGAAEAFVVPRDSTPSLLSGALG